MSPLLCIGLLTAARQGSCDDVWEVYQVGWLCWVASHMPVHEAGVGLCMVVICACLCMRVCPLCMRNCCPVSDCCICVLVLVSWQRRALLPMYICLRSQNEAALDWALHLQQKKRRLCYSCAVGLHVYVGVTLSGCTWA